MIHRPIHTFFSPCKEKRDIKNKHEAEKLLLFRRTWTLKHYVLSPQRRDNASWPGTSEILIQELLITLTLSPTSADSEMLAWNIHFPRTCTRIHNADSGT